MSRSGALLLAALVTLTGCGSPDLWARYRAERQYWKASRQVKRIDVNPRLAAAADYERAIAAFARLEREFPAEIWVARARASRDARAVAMLSGEAQIAIATLEDRRGRSQEALAAFERAGALYPAITPVAVKSLLGQARIHEDEGRAEPATAAWAEIARRFPPVDPETGEIIRPVLDAPLKVAAALKRERREQVADSVLDAADQVLLAAAREHSGRTAAPELWARIASLRASRGPERLDPALDALRSALAEPAASETRSRLILSLAEYNLQGHRPDSAQAYARWARDSFQGPLRGEAMLLEARIWETTAVDSALAAYARFLEAFPNSGDPVFTARFRRAELLEQTGRWEQARSEFRALATLSPTHELSLRSSERIVAHHLSRGETELGRIEAKRALEQLDHLIATVSDGATLARIRHVRARTLLAIGSDEQAFEALQEIWSRHGDSDLGASAGFMAARVAEERLRDPERARRLYQELAARSHSAADQETARAELSRLRRGRG